MRLSFIAPLAALALSACSLTPPLVKPAAPIPASYGEVDAPGSAADLGWRQMLPDARLQRLVALALENNRDLRVASLKSPTAHREAETAKAHRG